MAKEIEVKYLVKKVPSETINAPKEKIVQGYLHRSHNGGNPKATIRVRQLGNRGFITIKGEKTGISQPEFEYEIPLQDAQELFALCESGLIEKTRYYIPHGQHTIELDVFEGRHSGLILAEIELNSEDEQFDIPNWFDINVSQDPAYTNAGLSQQ